MRGKKPELLLPAGGPETLRTAVLYGADAVYLGGESFGLRAKAKNFDRAEMEQGIRFAHAHGKKVYITVNIIARDSDLSGVRSYLGELREIRPDALIIADPGIFSIAGEVCPEIPRHISTQANCTNSASCRFWQAQGAGRIVLARELSLAEIRGIRENIPEDLELETFVHGAMCISYSGRCLLSSFLTGRDANRGACTHPCRWRYSLQRKAEAEENGQEGAGTTISADEAGRRPDVFAVREESRPDEYFPVEEDERGTYIFHSKDLCMVEHIPDLIAAGIDSFKVEGRMKSPLYVASVARTYRAAIDDFLADPLRYEKRLPWYREQITAAESRPFCTGFYYGRPGAEGQVYEERESAADPGDIAAEGKAPGRSGGTQRAGADGHAFEKKAGKKSGRPATAVFLGIVRETDADGLAVIRQKNKFARGDRIEIMRPDGRDEAVTVRALRDADGNSVPDAPHPLQELHLLLEGAAGQVCPAPGTVLRLRGGSE